MYGQTHAKFPSIILRCIVTQNLMLLYILHAVVFFKQFFFLQIIAQYLVLLLHVSTTKRGHRQGATVFEKIMQRGT